MKSPILSVSGLVKQYGTFTAVDNISFSLNEGEIVGLLGPNGAGKTTTIQMLLGLTEPTHGSISFFGKDLAHHREEIFEQINFVSAFSGMQTRVTVRENLEVFARLFAVSNWKEKVEKLSEALGVSEKLDTLYWHLSSGQRTRVNLVKSFLNTPKLILMDEPTASLDPEVVNVVLELIEDMRKREKVSILYTSHNMAEVTRICDRVIFLHRGKIIATDTPLGLTQRVGEATLRLTYDGAFAPVQTYLEKEQYTYVAKRAHIVEIALPEKMIPKVLFGLAKEKVWITDIEIEKPNLEDVFLAVAEKGIAALDTHVSSDHQYGHATRGNVEFLSKRVEQRSLGMRIHRIYAVILHAWHHMIHSRETWIDIGWFPVVTTLSLGGLTTYMLHQNYSAEAIFPLIAIVLWYALEVGNYSIALGALWEIWAKSFSSMFISPLTVEEFVVGHIVFSLFKQVVIIAILSLLTALLFGTSPFIFGPLLPIYLLLLAIYGWGFGIFVFGLILRFGTGLQSLAWGLVFGLQPLIGIYYPVDMLPPSVQLLSHLLAPTHVLSSARNQINGGAPLWESIGIAVLLDIVTVIIGYAFMKAMWKRARHIGTLARMEE